MEDKFKVTLAGGETSSVIFKKSIDDLCSYLKAYGENVFYVFDENSARILPSIPEKSVILESGEINKNMESLERIIGSALSFGSARDTRFVGFGGGVICDMTALAASLYMRGAKLTLVPTTLLSMVDASVGGKTAIDYSGGKNLIGTFYPAEDVIITTECLSSLSDREYRCGLGEVIKHSFLTEDDALFLFLRDNRESILSRCDEVLDEMVYSSLMVKCSLIEQDPLEKRGIRSFLNLGHTFGHALESMKGYSISHGEAVAWGVARALEASYEENGLDESVLKRGLTLLTDYGYDIGYRIASSSWESYYRAIGKDKKKSGGKVKFVLLSAPGRPYLAPLDEHTVRSLVVQKY